MKVVLIGDMHFANSNGSKAYQKNIKLFCDKVLFPTLLKYKIKKVLQTGDIFHSRTTTHSESLDNAKRCFFDKLRDNNIELELILGNHDLFYKESLSINTPELVLGEYKNITIHKEPSTLKLDEVTIDMFSWICDENRQKTLEYISKSKSDYCFAHLELVGFKMSKSHVAEHGDDPITFSKYKQVWSGHYHSKSQAGNILYLGNPTQDTFESVDELKGFHIFDTETREMEFIENPYNLFERIVYDDSKAIQSKDITEKYVKLVIENCTDNKKLESYIESLWMQNPHDIKVVDNMVASDAIDSDITIEQLESSSFELVSFLTQYSNDNNENLDDTQKSLISDTYKKLFTMNKEMA